MQRRPMMNATEFDKYSQQRCSLNRDAFHRLRCKSYARFCRLIKRDHESSIYLHRIGKVQGHRQIRDGMKFQTISFRLRGFCGIEIKQWVSLLTATPSSILLIELILTWNRSVLPRQRCCDHFSLLLPKRYFPKLPHDFDHQSMLILCHSHCPRHTIGWPLLWKQSQFSHHLYALNPTVVSR